MAVESVDYLSLAYITVNRLGVPRHLVEDAQGVALLAFVIAERTYNPESRLKFRNWLIYKARREVKGWLYSEFQRSVIPLTAEPVQHELDKDDWLCFRDALAALDDISREVLYRFGTGQTMREILKRFGCDVDTLLAFRESAIIELKKRWDTSELAPVATATKLGNASPRLTRPSGSVVSVKP